MPDGGRAQQPGQPRAERAASPTVTGAQHEGIGSQGGPRGDRRERGRQPAHPQRSPARDVLRRTPFPTHVACVMDGNGRWAAQRGLARTEGHSAGEAALLDAVEGALELGIPWLTMYAFSTENWRRPAGRGPVPDGVQRVPAPPPPGRAPREGCPHPLRRPARLAGSEAGAEEDGRIDRADRVEPADDAHHGVQLRRTCRDRRRGAHAGRQGCLRRPDQREERSDRTSTSPTSPTRIWSSGPPGEYRISNFLLWQIAYSELVFDDVLWPDFRRSNLFAAVHDYQQRQRRYGGVG